MLVKCEGEVGLGRFRWFYLRMGAGWKRAHSLLHCGREEAVARTQVPGCFCCSSVSVLYVHCSSGSYVSNARVL